MTLDDIDTGGKDVFDTLTRKGVTEYITHSKNPTQLRFFRERLMNSDTIEPEEQVHYYTLIEQKIRYLTE